MRHSVLSSVALALFSFVWTAQAQCSAKVRLDAVGLPQKDRAYVLKKLQESKSCSPTDLPEMVRAIVRDRGYLKAELRPSRDSDASTISIVVGPQYRFRGFTVRGNRTLNEGQIRKAYTLRPGELASVRLLGQTFENMRIAYMHVGLRNVVVVPVVRFDDKARLVTFNLEIDEGNE